MWFILSIWLLFFFRHAFVPFLAHLRYSRVYIASIIVFLDFWILTQVSFLFNRKCGLADRPTISIPSMMLLVHMKLRHNQSHQFLANAFCIDKHQVTVILYTVLLFEHAHGNQNIKSWSKPDLDDATKVGFPFKNWNQSAECMDLISWLWWLDLKTSSYFQDFGYSFWRETHLLECPLSRDLRRNVSFLQGTDF